MEGKLYPVGFPSNTSYLLGLDDDGNLHKYLMDAFWSPTTLANMIATVNGLTGEAGVSAASAGASAETATNAAEEATVAAATASDSSATAVDASAIASAAQVSALASAQSAATNANSMTTSVATCTANALSATNSASAAAGSAVSALSNANAVVIALASISAGPVVSINGAGGVITGVTMNANNLSDMVSPSTALSNIGGVPSSSKGVAYGVASLNAVGQVPNAQLPVYSVNGRVGAVTTAAADITDSGTTGRAILQSSTTSAAQTAIGATSLGSQVLTSVNQSQAIGYLGGTTVGQAVFQAANQSQAIGYLGGTTVGQAVFQAASASVAATAIGATTIGLGLITASNVPSALTFLGATTVGAQVFSASTSIAALTALGVGTPFVRQTVAYGPIGSNGAPLFLPYSTGTNSITSQYLSSSYPLVATAANGWLSGGDVWGSSSTNLTWSWGTAPNQELYLYVVINSNGTLTPGVTGAAPVYQYGGTPNVAANYLTFNYGEMRMYVGNGTTASQTNVVFVGEVTTNSSSYVIASLPYAYNGFYESGWQNGLPTGATTLTFQSNLGYSEGNGFARIKCISADNGYSVGDIILCPGPSGQEAPSIWVNRVQIGASVGSSGYGIFSNGNNKTTGTAVNLTAAKWAYMFTHKRAW